MCIHINLNNHYNKRTNIKIKAYMQGVDLRFVQRVTPGPILNAYTVCKITQRCMLAIGMSAMIQGVY